MEIYFTIGLIIFLASFTQGLTGFGFALVSIPLLSLVIDIKVGIALGALCGLVVNIYLTLRLRKHIKFSEIRYLIFGAVAGIPVGAYFLKLANPELLKIFLGVIVLIFVFSTSFNFLKHYELNDRWGYLFGLFAGLLGGAFNTNGPPILIYFALKDLSKNKHKASIAGFFLVTSIIIVADHAVTGVSDLHIFYMFLKQLPFVIAGLLIGDLLFLKISTKFYRKIIIAFLFFIGVFLIIQH